MPNRRLTLAVAAGVLVAASCASPEPDRGEPAVIDVVAEDFEFTAPDSAASGWTTFRLHNQGSEDHLFTLLRLPEGVTYAAYEADVVAAFDSVWPLFVDGTIDLSEAGERLEPLLPEWYPSEVVHPGGVSLLSPGGHAQTTVELDAGRYAWILGVPPENGEVETFTVE